MVKFSRSPFGFPSSQILRNLAAAPNKSQIFFAQIQAGSQRIKGSSSSLSRFQACLESNTSQLSSQCKHKFLTILAYHTFPDQPATICNHVFQGSGKISLLQCLEWGQTGRTVNLYAAAESICSHSCTGQCFLVDAFLFRLGAASFALLTGSKVRWWSWGSNPVHAALCCKESSHLLQRSTIAPPLFHTSFISLLTKAEVVCWKPYSQINGLQRKPCFRPLADYCSGIRNVTICKSTCLVQFSLGLCRCLVSWYSASHPSAVLNRRVCWSVPSPGLFPLLQFSVDVQKNKSQVFKRSLSQEGCDLSGNLCV